MRSKLICLLIIILINCCITTAQEKKDTDKQYILNFLQTVSAPKYKSSLRDFYKFFNGPSIEIEGGLRHEYAISKGIIVSWDSIDSRSLAIDRLLNDTTFKRLLIIKKKKNYKWTIFNSHELGVISTMFVVGVEHTAGSFQIQLINWPEENQYGICEILGPTGESIFSSVYQK
jgi:hypothetical protein